MGLGDETVTRVSVVVPVRDRRFLLRRLLDALAAQTLTDHEVVVVDDGSSDGAGDEVLADARSGRPVRLITNAGRGAVAARRTGVAAAVAPLLAFTDSDCVPVPGWLEAGVAALDAGADLVVGPTRPLREPRPLERTVAVAWDDGLCTTSNAFYRRSAYEKAGGFDLHAGARLGFRPGSTLRSLGFGEDTLLGWKVRRAGRVAFVPEAVVDHHVFEANLGEALRRAWTAGAFPALVREVPELRHQLLRHRVLLGNGSRLPLYTALLALARHRRLSAAGSLATWAFSHWRRTSEAGWSPRRRLAVLPAQLVVDAVAAASLVAGSVRARTPVL